MHRFRLILAISVIVLACAQPATASDALAMSSQQSADLAELRNFTLTDGLVDKYIAVHRDSAFPIDQVFVVLVDDSDTESDLDFNGNQEEEEDDCLQEAREERASYRSITETAAALDARPGVHVGLARHGISAREFLLVMSTLVEAALVDIPKDEDDCPSTFDTKNVISSANVVYYRKNEQRLRTALSEAARLRTKADPR